jgi:hypothetical protein
VRTVAKFGKNAAAQSGSGVFALLAVGLSILLQFGLIPGGVKGRALGLPGKSGAATRSVSPGSAKNQICKSRICKNRAVHSPIAARINTDRTT